MPFMTRKGNHEPTFFIHAHEAFPLDAGVLFAMVPWYNGQANPPLLRIVPNTVQSLPLSFVTISRSSSTWSE